MVESRIQWAFLTILVFLYFVPYTAANPELDVRILESEVTVSPGVPATVQVTYENVGDADLNLHLFVYDDGNNESSPRPTFSYEGVSYTTSINTGVIFGSLNLPVGEYKTLAITFKVSPEVLSGRYTMHVGGYQEKVDDSYIGFADDSIVLAVAPSPELSPPTLIRPASDAQISSTPVLEWSPVAGAEGYMYEISTSSTVDANGHFTQVVCSGITPSSSAVLSCTLQENLWYYWHVLAFAGEKTSPPSSTSRFIVVQDNHNPVLTEVYVSPESGNESTVYTYYAVYSDEDNDPPATITVYIDGSLYPMTAANSEDVSFTDGKKYQYTTTLSEGTHHYYVTCEDGRGGRARYPVSEALSGPVVSSSLSLTAPVPVYPANDAEVTSTPVLEWSPVTGAEGYLYEISTSSTVDAEGHFAQVACSGTTTSPSAVLSCGLQNNVWYYWHVWAFSGGSTSPSSDVVRFIIYQTLSSPVLSGPPVGALNVELRPVFSWSSVENAAAYTIQVSADTSFSLLLINEQISATSFVPSFDLTANTVYYWRVRAENDQSTSEWTQGNFTTGVASMLSVPHLMYPADNSENVELRPVFSWDPVERAATYIVQVSTSQSFVHFAINERISATSYMTSFDLEPDTVYYWRVRAENQEGPGEWSRSFVFTTAHLEGPTLSAPAVATPDGEKGEGAITLSWNAVSEADSYTVQVSKASSFTPASLEKINSGTAVTTTSTSVEVSLLPGTYYWRVRAANDKGISDWSKGIHHFVITESNKLQNVVFNPVIQGVVVISAVITIIYVVIPIFRKN